jgi:hypothetical protein
VNKNPLGKPVCNARCRACRWVVTNSESCSTNWFCSGSVGVPGNSPHISAGVIICVGIGAASVDFAPDTLSAKDDPAQAASESLAPSTAITEPMESAVRRPTQKRRIISSPQAREALPPLELNEDDDGDRKPRARLVSVIH